MTIEQLDQEIAILDVGGLKVMSAGGVCDRLFITISEDERTREPMLRDSPTRVVRRGFSGEDEALFNISSLDQQDREVDLRVGVVWVELKGVAISGLGSCRVLLCDAAAIVEMTLRASAELDGAAPEGLLCLPVPSVAV